MEKKNESIYSKIRDKTSVPTLTTTIQHSFGSPSHSNKRKKKKKKESILEKKSQNSQFADYMILYLENPNDTSRKLLGLINEYNTLSLVFLYNNNKRTEREIKETILLTIAMRRKNT